MCEETGNPRRVDASVGSQANSSVDNHPEGFMAPEEAAAGVAAVSASEMKDQALEVFSVVESEPRKSSQNPLEKPVESAATKGLVKIS